MKMLGEPSYVLESMLREIGALELSPYCKQNMYRILALGSILEMRNQ